MKQSIHFPYPVCKFGTVDGAILNSSTPVEAGDVVNFRLAGVNEADATEAEFQDLTLTNPHGTQEGKFLMWDMEAANENIHSRQIAGVALKHNRKVPVAEIVVPQVAKTAAKTSTFTATIDGTAEATLGVGVVHNSHATQADLDAAILVELRKGFPDAYQNSDGDYVAPHSSPSADTSITLTTP